MLLKLLIAAGVVSAIGLNAPRAGGTTARYLVTNGAQDIRLLEFNYTIDSSGQAIDTTGILQVDSKSCLNAISIYVAPVTNEIFCISSDFAVEQFEFDLPNRKLVHVANSTTAISHKPPASTYPYDPIAYLNDNTILFASLQHSTVLGPADPSGQYAVAYDNSSAHLYLVSLTNIDDTSCNTSAVNFQSPLGGITWGIIGDQTYLYTFTDDYDNYALSAWTVTYYTTGCPALILAGPQQNLTSSIINIAFTHIEGVYTISYELTTPSVGYYTKVGISEPSGLVAPTPVGGQNWYESAFISIDNTTSTTDNLIAFADSGRNSITIWGGEFAVTGIILESGASRVSWLSPRVPL